MSRYIRLATVWKHKGELHEIFLENIFRFYGADNTGIQCVWHMDDNADVS